MQITNAWKISSVYREMGRRVNMSFWLRWWLKRRFAAVFATVRSVLSFNQASFAGSTAKLKVEMTSASFIRPQKDLWDGPIDFDWIQEIAGLLQSLVRGHFAHLYWPKGNRSVHLCDLCTIIISWHVKQPLGLFLNGMISEVFTLLTRYWPPGKRVFRAVSIL